MIAVPLALALVLGASSGNLLKDAPGNAPASMSDGVAAFEGDDWTAGGATRLTEGSSVQWDFGSEKSVRSFAIQADNNDTYILEGSSDSKSWTPVFSAGPVPLSGLRTRSGAADWHGRYLRLRAEGGDGRFSVSEVELFEEAGAKGSVLLRPFWMPRHALDTAWVELLLAAALALVLTTERSPKWKLGVGLGLLAAAAAHALWQTVNAPQLPQERLAWIRATAAVLAMFAVIRQMTFRRRWPSAPVIVIPVLGISGVVGVLCFLNFVRPQFHDAGRNAPTFLHHYDMRTYFPIAKYFRELRFDGVYAASAAAVAEDRGPSAVAGSTMRNLRTHELQKVSDAQPYVAEIRARFTPERWSAFTKDMRYFRTAMSDSGFLGSMEDHGGNATPVWFVGAALLFSHAPASDFTLWLGVLVDAALMLAAFGALWWAYGPRTAFVAMTVFGAMDFYLFGTNWFGATLRHDWLALWCLGLAMIRRERFVLAGVFLAWAALIRAFPALTFITLTAPVAWEFVIRLWRQRRAFSFAAFLKDQRPFLRIALGALGATVVLVGASLLMFGASAWAEWLHKVLLLNGSGHVNNIALSQLVVERTALKLIGVALTLWVLIAVRRSPLDEAAAFGAALVGIVFNPANYYLQCLFLLAVLGRERDGGVPWLVLLAMCAGCYYATLTGDLGLHYRRESGLMLAAVVALLLWQTVESFLERRASKDYAAPPVPVEQKAPQAA
ncbi:MAG: hypothetical protein ACJ790_07765 [Myxococcaceae bacterium]